MFVTEARRATRASSPAAAVRRGARLVIAWGGDGTINEVASALAFGEVPLGIVPAGSGNGLARELGVDPRPRTSRSPTRSPPTPRRWTSARSRAGCSSNIAGIGVDAFVASRFSLARRRGFLGYVGITAQRARHLRAHHATASPADGTRVDARAVLVTIANSAQFGNGARIAPGARVDDGLLDLVVLEERWRLATIVPAAAAVQRHRRRGSAAARSSAIREVTIEADQPMTFHVDGEPVVGGTRLDRARASGRAAGRRAVIR